MKKNHIYTSEIYHAIISVLKIDKEDTVHIKLTQIQFQGSIYTIEHLPIHIQRIKKLKLKYIDKEKIIDLKNNEGYQMWLSDPKSGVWNLDLEQVIQHILTQE